MRALRRYVLLPLLVAAATTGLGISVVFGAIGMFYMAHGISAFIGRY